LEFVNRPLPLRQLVQPIADVAELALTEQTLRGIQDCMARSPAPWPGAWQREYVDMIRNAIASHQDTPQYATRLEILYNGFQPYWQGLKKSQDRSLFEVHCAQIRWYAPNVPVEAAGPFPKVKDEALGRK